MSIIQAVREYMAECPLLAEIPVKARYIDWTDDKSTNYGIFVDSDNIVKKFVSGGGKHEYNFVIQARLRRDDKKSLENAELVERLGKWCAAQTAAKNFPKLPEGCTPTKLTAANGYLYENDDTGKTGLYQLQLKLSYISRN